MRSSITRARLRQALVARIVCMYYPCAMLPAHAARAGFDAVWLDAEHNAWDHREIQRLIALHHLANIDCIVRTGSRNPNELYRLLEDGATGVMIPHVDTAADADALVRAVKFPPIGQRGVDGAGLDNDFYFYSRQSYVAAATEETLLILQIESTEALANLDSIAAIPGVDALFIGPGDLALSIGCDLDWNGPEMTAAEDAVAAAATNHGIAWGRPAGDEEQIARAVRKSAQLIAHGSDFGAIMAMLPSYAQTFSSSLDNAPTTVTNPKP